MARASLVINRERLVMTEFLEPVAVPPPPISHDDDCPFCKEKECDCDRSKIGKDNSASKLESNLAADGEPRDEVGFHHEDYGDYSSEPHHLVPGKEAMDGHPIERWLAKKAKGTYVNGDTCFDINDERNGIWLPSITDANRICKWKTIKKTVGGKVRRKRVPAHGEKSKEMWSSLSDDEKDLISFSIMRQERLQFHKANHRNKGKEESECYINEVERLLNDIFDFVDSSWIVCEEIEEDSKGKVPPPNGINEMIYGMASAHMGWHVSGPAESWFVFISKLARRCHQYAIDEGKTPWDAPYPGHPGRS